jgi:hypothetical protein
MTTLFWLMAVISTVRATSLYDASEGRIGYQFPDLILTPSCLHLADLSPEMHLSPHKGTDSGLLDIRRQKQTETVVSRWSICAQDMKQDLKQDMNEALSSGLDSQPVSRQQRMYVVTAFLRAGEIDAAFETFEPLLRFLETNDSGYNHRQQTSEQSGWTDEHWSVVILEAWLLSTVGLDRESLSLLENVPSTTGDAGGKYIVETNIRHRRYQFRKRNRLWKESLTSPSISAWNWWHKA